MNGAESLIRSLTNAGVNVCFANPDTSEMHLVQAIDRVPEMRPVLALFEGVCSGAADGYGRMTGMPATTLLHLGPGFGNGIANLHNARRAGTPIINLVGNHASYHIEHDAPLTSDIDTLAKNVSSWIKSDSTSDTLAADGMEALAAALTPKGGSRGQISTLIIPADACWGSASGVAEPGTVAKRETVSDEVIRAIGDTLDNASTILINGEGLTQQGLIAANRVAAVTGCKVGITTFPSRIDGGAGTPSFSRLPYFPEQILGALKGTRLLPEDAIICGDSGGGGAAFGPTQHSVPHTWLNLTGGSIGQGGPASIGAAVACAGRRVLALLGDGACMYTNQSLWTQAREGFNVTTVIFNNKRYGILETEYMRLGVNEIGGRAASLFDLTRPTINFVQLANSMGVPGTVAKTAEEFQRELELSFSQAGPFLIEARV